MSPRYVIIGAGAIGGALAGSMVVAGIEVALAAYAAAGIDVDDASRRPRQISDHYGPPTAARATEPLGSSWQSLKRRTSTVETDYLNGGTVMLGRRFGAPTPANWALQTARIRGSPIQASGSRRGEGFADSGSGRPSWIGGRRNAVCLRPSGVPRRAAAGARCPGYGRRHS
jgi:hypothetical protein